MDIIQNPIVLGITATVLTYLYFWWQEKKRREQEPDIKDQPISIITPLAVGVIVWFASATYFDMTKNSTSRSISTNESSSNASSSISVSANKKAIVTKSPMAGGSYHFVGKNKIRLPPTDVFLDIAKF